MMAAPRHLTIVEPATETVMPPSELLALAVELYRADEAMRTGHNGERFARPSIAHYLDVKRDAVAALIALGRANS